MALSKVGSQSLDLNKANTESGLKMPSGTAFSGTPAEGMMRNDTGQESAGSSTTMQHYNGSQWKNFVNTPDTTPFNADMLIVGGGGGSTNLCGAGGAGGGGVLEGTVSIVPTTNYSVQVGTGGTGSTGPSYTANATNGQNSFFDNSVAGGNVLTANGGGRSAGAGPPQASFISYPGSGDPGGSGGAGGGYQGNNSNSSGAASNQTSISPLTGYGNAGGSMITVGVAAYTGAGGGGAGSAGADVNGGTTPGVGGTGHISTIVTTTMASTNGVGEVVGSDVYYAAGGGGAQDATASAAGGLGGGGNGGSGSAANNGTPSTGGGAGGGNCAVTGNTGGTGVLIIKYPDSKTCNLSSATNLTHQTDTTSISGFHVSFFTVTSGGTNGTGTVTFT
jgi:hypothetical protein